MDDGRLENEIRPKRRSGGARIALMVAAVVVISAAAVATGTAMTGQQAANGPVQVSVGGGAALTPPIATTPTPVPTTPVTTVPAQTPPATPPPAGSTKSGGASPSSAPGGSHATTAAKPPAAPKTAPANTPVTIGGQLTCSSGKSIEGVWVSTTTGSGYAPWQGLGNNVSKYWYTLPTSEPYSVHVGCGGTQADWGVACYGPQVTNPADSFECFDVSGAGGYETCGVK